ncbi:ABC transporter ATP-binding protein [Fluviicola sp.]|jgi:ABC-type bacteriocin/lantibiotic exporter with double-glycine peptidase domain|uniref:ABC transporter ATP-binding protein n=1 Tax=Fluviicola sp. TaxID=1917219 RepID=UPI002828B324|nr:ABC transporter ATP-binding protein [Fluviicola sp.]MDR0801731.1 ABC transporter ATP-binding protein/permease [Fluviicola sp.]
MFKKNILFKTRYHFKHDLPPEIARNANKLIPVLLFTGILELTGLLILFPVITILLDPKKIKNEPLIIKIYQATGLNSIQQFIIFSFGLLCLFFIVKNLILFLVYKKQSKVQFQLATQIVNERFESYLLNEQGILREENIAVLLRNVTQIPYEFVSFIFVPYLNLISEIIFLLLIGIIILLYNPMLVLTITAFAIPFLWFYNKFYKRKLSQISEIRDKKGAEQYKIAYQSIESSVEIKIFQKEHFFVPQFVKVTEEFESSMTESNLLNLFSPKLIETVAVSSIFMLILTGIFLGKNIVELGEFLIVFSISAIRIIPSLNKIVLSANYMKGSFHVFGYLKNLHLSKQRPTGQGTSAPPLVFNQDIEFRNITYRYAQKDILSQLNFHVKKNEKVGIIGESGSGKSTFLSLILLLIKQQSGSYLIDGNPVTPSDHSVLYPLIAYVPQTAKLVYGSVAENIAFGVPKNEINYEKVRQLISIMKLDSFIDSLPSGVHSFLGENNLSISGGQKQRLGIARALYFERPILILDESTSALDYHTENEIIDNLIARPDLTILFVTHRLKSLSKFDKVFELNNGKLSKKTP